jgi:hypothetical protein
MKYIIIHVTDIGSDGGRVEREVPMIFPDLLVHKEVADFTMRLLRREQPDGRMRVVKPVAAGFLSSMAIGHPDRQVCHGESESLGLKSRPQDSKLIHLFDYAHGIL